MEENNIDVMNAVEPEHAYITNKSICVQLVINAYITYTNIDAHIVMDDTSVNIIATSTTARNARPPANMVSSNS